MYTSLYTVQLYTECMRSDQRPATDRVGRLPYDIRMRANEKHEQNCTQENKYVMAGGKSWVRGLVGGVGGISTSTATGSVVYSKRYTAVLTVVVCRSSGGPECGRSRLACAYRCTLRLRACRARSRPLSTLHRLPCDAIESSSHSTQGACHRSHDRLPAHV